MLTLPTHSMTLKDDEIVVIPDVHEDTEWLDQVLQKCKKTSRIVFLGDLFDRKPEDGRDPRLALDYYTRLVDDDRLVFLWGNHDTCVFASWYVHRFLGGKFPENILDWAFDPRWLEFPFDDYPWLEQLFAKFQPFALYKTWLLSHAGIHRGLLPRNPNVDDLQELFDRAHHNLWHFPQCDELPPEWACGAIRGGPPGAIGGLSWQDFRYEFEDALPWPQIVGHTRLARPATTGRSYCMDAGQSAWMRISHKGQPALLVSE